MFKMMREEGDVDVLEGVFPDVTTAWVEELVMLKSNPEDVTAEYLKSVVRTFRLVDLRGGFVRLGRLCRDGRSVDSRGYSTDFEKVSEAMLQGCACFNCYDINLEFTHFLSDEVRLAPINKG